MVKKFRQRPPNDARTILRHVYTNQPSTHNYLPVLGGVGRNIPRIIGVIFRDMQEEHDPCLDVVSMNLPASVWHCRMD